LTDQKIRHRVTFGVQHHDIIGILHQSEQASQGNGTSRRPQNLSYRLIVYGAFVIVFGEYGTTFVGPARHRRAEVIGQHRMRDFVRQHAGEQPIRRALNVHVDGHNAAAIESKFGRAAGSIGNGDAQRTRSAPRRHFMFEPLHRFLFAIMFGILADLFGESGVRRFDDEIGRAIRSAERCHRADQHESD
jgi:hypothetical protein